MKIKFILIALAFLVLGEAQAQKPISNDSMKVELGRDYWRITQKLDSALQLQEKTRYLLKVALSAQALQQGGSIPFGQQGNTPEDTALINNAILFAKKTLDGLEPYIEGLLKVKGLLSEYKDYNKIKLSDPAKKDEL